MPEFSKITYMYGHITIYIYIYIGRDMYVHIIICALFTFHKKMELVQAIL